MVKILSCLLLLLLTVSKGYAQSCYADSWVNNMPVYNTIHGYGTATTIQCQQVACQIWSTLQGCPNTVPLCQPDSQTQVLSCQQGYNGSITQTRQSTCTTSGNKIYGDWVTSSNTCQPIITTETQTLSCPIHQSGQITQQRTITANVAGAWQTIQNTCVQDPPSCKTSTQTQTLSCQTGYVGLITQTNTSTCPDPYGQPIWSGWLTTTDTCVKSLTNPTNLNSPISPISPTNPTSVVNQSISTPALTTSSAPATVQPSVQTTPTTTETPSQTGTGGSPAPQTASPATSTPAPTVAPKTEAKPTANTQNSNKIATVVGNIIKLEIITQASIKQPDLFPIIDIGQAIPESIRRNQELYFQFIQGESIDFGGEQDMRMNAIKQFTLEYENEFGQTN